MFKITKDHVTCWTITQGYGRRAPSAAWCAFADDTGGDSDECLQRAGYWERIRAAGHAENDWQYDIHLLEHGETGELVVLLDAGDGWLAGVFVDEQDADAFMFTEYLEIHERVVRISRNERQRVGHRAHLAFIRHGHGDSTVTEDGQTREEVRNERERLRLLAERRRQTPTQSGA